MEVYIRLERLNSTPKIVKQVQAVLDDAPKYSFAVIGMPPQDDGATLLFSELPPNKSYPDKHVLGFYLGGLMIGCADLIMDYPSNGIAFVGLFLLAETWQRQGLGKQSLVLLEAYAKEILECNTLRLAVVRNNAGVIPFWELQGFMRTGETRPYSGGTITSECILFEKKVTANVRSPK